MNWISVKERMPKLYEWTLVVIAGVVQKTAANYAGDTWDWFDDEADSAPCEVVTHWMPLPDPPVEDSSSPQVTHLAGCATNITLDCDCGAEEVEDLFSPEVTPEPVLGTCEMTGWEYHAIPHKEILDCGQLVPHFPCRNFKPVGAEVETREEKS
jgi:hypothetical protein